jgi:hypothetical protein
MCLVGELPYLMVPKLETGLKILLLVVVLRPRLGIEVVC